MPDRAYRRSIDEMTVTREGNPWLNLANSYEWVGSLVRQGLIDESAFMDVYSYRVLKAWDIVKDVIAIRRRSDPATWENFEYLYVKAQLWERRHPQGVYPKGVPRAGLQDPWLAADRADP